MTTAASHYRESRRAAAWGLALGLGLGLAKLIGGYMGQSLALVSDAIHSLVEAASAGGLLAALLVAERPADREHPYGHGRLEAVAEAGVALLLLGLAAGIAWEAVTTLHRPHPPLPAYTLVIAAVGAVFQEWFHQYTSQIARRTGSDALLATAWDSRLDAFGGLVVVLGIALARYGGGRWHWADHAAAFFISGAVLWMGACLLHDKINDLMDRQAPADVLAAVRAAASSVSGVLGVETLRVRKAGLEYLVDIHIEVAPELTVEVGHAIAHAVKDRIRSTVDKIHDVLVHVEPYRRTP
jgi:cation diffusion facilitator family transporter